MSAGYIGERNPDIDDAPTYPAHLLEKLENCPHSWVRSNTYESGMQCGMCAISFDMHQAYEKDMRR